MPAALGAEPAQEGDRAVLRETLRGPIPERLWCSFGDDDLVLPD